MRSTDLKGIYAGPMYKDRLQHFDTGGGYNTYYNQYAAYNTQSPSQLRDSGGGGGNIAQFYTNPANNDPGYANPQIPTVDPGSLTDLPPSLAAELQTNTEGSSVPGMSLNVPNSPQNNLSGLLSSLGMGSGMAGGLSSLMPLLPLLGAALGYPKGPQQPGLPSQYQGSPMNLTPPNYSMTPNPYYSSGSGGGSSGSGMTMNDWLHVAEQPGGMPQFYQNNMLPATANSAPNQQLQYALGPGASILPSMASTGGGQVPLSAARAHGGYISPHYVQGPGDGTSDDINAKLSNGEYVFDAQTVSLLGNGSNEAGAKALDQMRVNVRKHAGQKLSKGKQLMRAHPPERYLNAEYA